MHVENNIQETLFSFSFQINDEVKLDFSVPQLCKLTELILAEMELLYHPGRRSNFRFEAFSFKMFSLDFKYYGTSISRFF